MSGYPILARNASSFSIARPRVSSDIQSNFSIRILYALRRFSTNCSIRLFAAAEKYFSTYMRPISSPNVSSSIAIARFQRGFFSFCPDISRLKKSNDISYVLSSINVSAAKITRYLRYDFIKSKSESFIIFTDSRIAFG